MRSQFATSARLASLALALTITGLSPALAEDADPNKVSFHKQVRPIFKANCQGCHQPAKAGGEYVMTDFATLLKGGESESAAVTPGKADDSYLLELITPTDGKAEMPKGKKPLAEVEIDLIRRWIEQGAEDDTPPSTRVLVDADHPPVYSRLPVVTSLDFSADGEYLAVAGYHEVLLHKADGSEIVARLIGLSQRIESVRFSPDSKLLAVTGGLPGETGEVQIWDVAARELKLSVPVSYDTLYGAKWSPDGKLVSFGGGDNIVRAIEADTGKEVLFQGAHDDWALDTTFNAKGTHVISVSRDRSVKLTELKTQRFIDNVTSITPGALKGGIAAVESHPERDEILVGGADGTPKLYRIFRTSARKIGDDANLIRVFPTMNGRVFDVAISHDGSRIAAVSGLDGRGEVRVYAYDFDTNLPGDVKAIMSKRSYDRSAAEKQKLEEYRRDGVRVQAEADIDAAAAYAVAFSADGKQVAASGSDGIVRLIDSETGEVSKTFGAAPLGNAAGGGPIASGAGVPAEELRRQYEADRKLIRRPQPSLENEQLPKGVEIASITVEPQAATIVGKYNAVQYLVTGHTASGATLDLTRLANVKVSSDAVAVSERGHTRVTADGDYQLTFEVAGKTATAKLSGREIGAEVHPDFIRDIRPALTRMGCNAGTCHGSNKGKNGFKLSLRGNDAIFDLRALTDDLKSRRVNRASPENSLMLLKATSTVPHEGGQLTSEGEPYYELLKQWIADGVELDMTGAKVESIAISPSRPIIERADRKQQFRVVATFTDGTTRDVTAESFISVSDIELAREDGAGLFTALRRGEGAILARYEGAYAAAPLTIMGDREEFVWEEQPANNFIDELVHVKQQTVKTLPSGLCTDAEFIRRIYLDLTGLPPTVDQVNAFLADSRDTREKREALIDELIGSPDYIDYWTNKWADLLQVNGKFLAREGAQGFRNWIREQVAANKPYDEFAYEVLTASGSNKEHPAASYFKITRTPEDTMENTTHLFLAVRFNCNKCHDHPFEKWTQDQYYETAAYFAQFDLKKDPASGNRQIGKSAVDSGKPLYEIVTDTGKGEMTHERTGEIAPPQFPYPAEHETADDASRRERLAAWITSPDNQYFARSYVNRVWGYLTGTGLIEPLDDIRAGNPPSNPALLDRLTEEFIASDFNVQQLMTTICKSRTYQLSIDTNRWNEDDTLNYTHAKARRLPAEVLYDTLHRVTGAPTNFPGVPAGTRAAALPDVGIELPSGFLGKFGRPARETACECERSEGLQLGPIMALISGPVVDSAISSGGNEITKLAQSEIDNAELVNALFMRVLSRPATEGEIAAGVSLIGNLPAEHEKLVASLKAYEEALAEQTKQEEEARLARIEAAKQKIASREAEIADEMAAKEKARQERIAAADKAVKDHEATLPEKLAAWIENREQGAKWEPLAATEMTSDMGSKFAQGEDKSIVVTGPMKIGQYVITMPTEARKITGIRLEAIADKQFPKSGPGRAPGDGNFVVTEFEVHAAAKATPDQKLQVKLTGAQADFSQNAYPVATAIDGQVARQGNGWAIAPQMGKDHVAVFQLTEPLDQEGGSILTFTLKQHYQSGQHTLGKFRISVTTTTDPIVIEKLPDNVAKALEVAADKRNDAQKNELLNYYKGIDPTLKQLQAKLSAERQPLPVDGQLQQHRNELAAAQQAPPVDPKWQQLKADIELSKAQLGNARLTAAQDIVWALVNTPAFLFNR